MSDAASDVYAPSYATILVCALARYREHAASYVAIVGLAQLPISLVTAASAISRSLEATRSPRTDAAVASLVSTVLLPQLLLGGLVTGALAAAMHSDSSGGRSLGTLRAYTAVLRRLAPLTGALVVQLAALALVGIATLLLSIGALLGSNALTDRMGVRNVVAVPMILGPPTIAVLLGAGAAAYLTLRWCFLAQAIVVERCGALMALRRSARLVHRRPWLVGSCTVTLALIQALVPSLASGIGTAALPAGSTSLVGSVLVALVISLLVTPYQVVGNVVLFEVLRDVP